MFALIDTKLKSDIAESAAATCLLRHGFRVLRPIGDRLPYDLCVDLDGKLIKLQIKSAWRQNGNFIVDTRRTKTNRKRMLRSRYCAEDFDFALIYVSEADTFYVMPVHVFCSYKSGISLALSDTRQRKPRSDKYREAWNLLRD